MYNTALTRAKISSGENQGQAEYKSYGIVWDNHQNLSNSKVEQPVIDDYRTHIVSQDDTYIVEITKKENRKVTVYMDKSLFDRISQLKKNGRINTFSQLTVDAINEYILKHHIG